METPDKEIYERIEQLQATLAAQKDRQDMMRNDLRMLDLKIGLCWVVIATVTITAAIRIWMIWTE